MVATFTHLQEEANRLTVATSSDSDSSASKKKRAREARKLAAKVQSALVEGRVEEDIKGVTLKKVFSKASTKQAMIARASIRVCHASELRPLTVMPFLP